MVRTGSGVLPAGVSGACLVQERFPEYCRGISAMTQSHPGSAKTRTHGATFRPPQPSGLTPVLERNIRSMDVRREREEAQASREERVAQAITDFTGSMKFVYLHLAIFGFWVIANLGLVPGVSPWDPSFVVLAMVASVEAIFLSTFVLISQNRISAAADKRADLDLQISLLAEHEVTKIAELVSAMAQRMGVEAARDPEIEEIKQDVAPEAVLDEIESTSKT
jgi:uncharacterized membrane protein